MFSYLFNLLVALAFETLPLANRENGIKALFKERLSIKNSFYVCHPFFLLSETRSVSEKDSNLIFCF